MYIRIIVSEKIIPFIITTLDLEIVIFDITSSILFIILYAFNRSGKNYFGN